MAWERPIISFEEGWNSIEEGLAKLKNILEERPEQQPITPKLYMQMYSTAYDMCTQKPPYEFSEQLYNKYRETFEEYMNSVVLPSLNAKHGEFLLKELSKRSENHKVMVRWLSKIFYYLDRYYIHRRSLPELIDVGNTCFCDVLYKDIKGKVRDAMLAMIHREREGEQIDRSLLKTYLNLFGEVNGFKEDFERAVLEETSRYYSIKASNWIVEYSCPDYMVKAEECLQREKDMVWHYLQFGNRGKLLEKVQTELVVVYSKQLLDNEQSGYAALLRDNKVEDLTRMYRLYSRVPIQKGLEPASLKFQHQITSESTMLVKQVEDAGMSEHVYIRKVIELHEKYLGYVEGCFVKHSIFHKALKEAFEVFCNKEVDGSSSAEVLATFCDSILKKGAKEKLTDDAIEDTLDKVLKVLGHISDKDLFGELCRKKLARRLLFDRCASEELEKSLLTKLKEQYGGQFTSKMQGMMTDLALAKETNSKFQEYQDTDEQAKPGLSLSVTVLTAGLWPSYKSKDVNLPMEMVKCVELFNKYYNLTTKSRKLTWIHSLGSCHINGMFEQKTIELIVTTYQACVLLLFNDSERLSYAEIKEQLNLPDDDVVRLLHSLSCEKYKILNKEPNTNSISPEDQFEFNTKFTHKMHRIKIPLSFPLLDEKKKVIEDVNKDRRYTIDASLVRIMKSRKVLGHEELVAECLRQLSKMFKPDIKVIKSRIEDLITREFLERDTANRTQYKYLA